MSNLNENFLTSEDLMTKNLVTAESCAEDFEDSFDGFLKKSVENQFHGALSCKGKSLSSIFNVAKRNYWREIFLYMKTDSTRVELPQVNGVEYSHVMHGAASPKAQYNPVIVDLLPIYVKWKFSRALFEQGNYADFLKNMGSSEIANLEERLFVCGHQDGFQGILNLGKVAKAIGNGDTVKVGDLIELIVALPDRYLKNAEFMMSGKVFNQVCSNALAGGQQMLFSLDVKQILGHKVRIIESLGSSVLFGDFKQAIAMCERSGAKLEMHSNFENPSQIGLSFPIEVGFGVINPDAIVLLKKDGEGVQKLDNNNAV